MSVGVWHARWSVTAWSTRPFNDRAWRVVAVARPGILALVVALTGAAGDMVQSWWWLVALALIAIAAGTADLVMPRVWAAPAAEAIAAATLIGLGLPDSYLGLPYLLVPGLAGGLAGSVTGCSVCAVAAAAGLLLGAALAPAAPFEAGTYVGLAPWVGIVFVMGLVGAFVRRQQNLHPADITRYAAAYRLLSELRVVSRQLSGGLDAVTLATGVLDDLARQVPIRRSALLVQREGGVLLPLARHGDTGNWLEGAERDQLVLDAWTSESPMTSSLGRRNHRVVLPVRVGSRTIGVVVADVSEAVSPEELQRLSRSTDDGALRLETALLFDEVREVATRDERRRLAREIHDGIAQELASLGYLVDDLQARAKGADLKSLSILLRKELSRILSDLRHSIFDLRSEIPADTYLGTALAQYARDVSAQSGLRVHLVHDEEGGARLRPEIEAELLRVGQEAINNVRKHAKARNLWVTVSVEPPNAHLQVADDGVGLRSRGSDSFGLEIMAERTRRVGAKLMIENRPEGGTVVDVSLGADNGKV